MLLHLVSFHGINMISLFPPNRSIELICLADDATLAQIESSRYDPVYNEVTRWKITNIEGNNYQ